jgi:hypothetical protein
MSKRLVHERLREFYASDMFKVKAFHRNHSMTATKNKGIDRVIAVTGWTKGSEIKSCFVVGDGEFGSGTETLHQEFVSLLKKRFLDAHGTDKAFSIL